MPSKEWLEEFDRAREEILLSQRKCAWCGKRCEDADHLFLHIVLRHPER